MVTARSQVQAGTFTADSTSVTVAEAAKLWLERCEAEGLEVSSLRQYRNHVDYHINPLIGTEKLPRLSVPRVEKFRDDLLDGGRSRAMAKKALSSLKSLIKEAQRRGLLAQNAARDVTVKTSGRHRKLPELGVDIPTKAEVKTLLDATSPRWRPLVITATFTGLRASELRGLRWEDMDLDKRLIRVRQRADRWGRIGPPKSATSNRDVPMSPMVLNALKEWKLASHGAGGLVFGTRTGKPESHANIFARCWYPLQIQAGITDGFQMDRNGKVKVDKDGNPLPMPKYGLHALRHFFASWLIDQGFGPKRVQALMGHATIGQTLDTYTHLWPQEDDHDKFAAGELALSG